MTIYDEIKAMEAAKLSYPTKPVKPVLKHGANSAEHKAYAIELEQHETYMVEYENQKAYVKAENAKVDASIEAFIIEAAGADKYNEAVKAIMWSKAWEDGRISGYHSVYQELEGIVDLYEQLKKAEGL